MDATFNNNRHQFYSGDPFDDSDDKALDSPPSTSTAAAKKGRSAPILISLIPWGFIFFFFFNLYMYMWFVEEGWRRKWCRWELMVIPQGILLVLLLLLLILGLGESMVKNPSKAPLIQGELNFKFYDMGFVSISTFLSGFRYFVSIWSLV